MSVWVEAEATLIGVGVEALEREKLAHVLPMLAASGFTANQLQTIARQRATGKELNPNE